MVAFTKPQHRRKEESEQLRGREIRSLCSLFLSFFLVSYVGKKPWWHIQSPNKGRKKKVKN